MSNSSTQTGLTMEGDETAVSKVSTIQSICTGVKWSKGPIMPFIGSAI